jgi:deoxycytidine triphosphate deaminase
MPWRTRQSWIREGPLAKPAQHKTKDIAEILNDVQLKGLFGTVLREADGNSIRPNSYVLRLGSAGEFLNSSKMFELGGVKKGIRVPPGNSVGLTACETVDFRPDVVQKIYPGCALHALISPTTDLSREGIVAPTTQIGAGYHGTLNWTITNTSSDERRFILGERLFRLTILLLKEGEVPRKYYDGDYQTRTGYVRSQRKGAPVGMRDSEWADPMADGGPEAMLENLMKSGFPWHTVGQRLKAIGEDMKIVSNEYSNIYDSLQRLSSEVENVAKQNDNVTKSLPQTVKSALNEQASAFQNRWMVFSGSMAVVLIGLILSFTGNERAMNFLKTNSAWLGLLLVLSGVIAIIIGVQKSKK